MRPAQQSASTLGSKSIMSHRIVKTTYAFPSPFTLSEVLVPVPRPRDDGAAARHMSRHPLEDDGFERPVAKQKDSELIGTGGLERMLTVLLLLIFDLERLEETSCPNLPFSR